MVAMTIDDRERTIGHAIAFLVFVVMFALPCAAQEKFRFPIGGVVENFELRSAVGCGEDGFL